MASVTKRPNRSRNDARYDVRYRLPGGAQRKATFRTRRDAEHFAATIETDARRGVLLDPRMAAVTFDDWADKYLASAHHKRATTLARDRNVLHVHFRPAFGARALGTLNPLDVRKVMDGMSKRLAPATVRTNYAVLCAVLNNAVAAEVIGRSPCRGIKLPAAQRRREVRFLTADELDRLGAAMPGEYRQTVYLGGVLGLRWSEVAGLRVGRVNLLRHTLEVVETVAEVEGFAMAADVKSPASRRVLELPGFLAEGLAQHLGARGLTGADSDEYVFGAPGGGPLRPANFRNRVWAPAVRAAGLEGLTFHHLRHSAVGFLIDANAHPAVMQRRIGHGSIRTTLDVYGHVLPSTDHGATEHLEALFSGRVRHGCAMDERP